MPVIIVGADTPTGEAVVHALSDREGEVRAFVSDPSVADDLKARGVKVAVGDLSDASHLGGAGLNAFSAVLIAAAAVDGRPLAFAPDTDGVFDAWAEGVRDAGVQRVIWVEDVARPGPRKRLRAAAPEFAVVAAGSRRADQVAADVAALDDTAQL